jgi:hypothetical protein
MRPIWRDEEKDQCFWHKEDANVKRHWFYSMYYLPLQKRSVLLKWYMVFKVCSVMIITDSFR